MIYVAEALCQQLVVQGCCTCQVSSLILFLAHALSTMCLSLKALLRISIPGPTSQGLSSTESQPATCLASRSCLTAFNLT